MGNRTYPEDPFHFAPLWDAILDVYDVFAAICKQYNLKHYVIGGTLLGAVRHKGFIPWDDDFDLAMPRQDYEKLKEILDVALPRHLKFVDHANTQEFKWHYVKIQDSRVDFVHELEKKINRTLQNGVFIDIFPLDGYVDSMIGDLFRKVERKIYYAIQYYSFNKSRNVDWTLRRLTGYWLGYVLSKIIIGILWDDEKWFAWNEAYIQKFPFDDMHRSGTIGCMVSGFQMIFGKQLFSEPALLDFCGLLVPAPSDWSGFLTINYGDYLQLPPENERQPKHSNGARRPWCFGPTNGK